MTQQANITVKKYDGTTDVVYSAVLPAAGGNPAEWRAPTLGTAVAHQPVLKIRSSKNKAGTVSRVEGIAVYPEIATAADGTKTVPNKLTITFGVVNPAGMAITSVQEGVYQLFNLIASAHVKTQAVEGFAAV